MSSKLSSVMKEYSVLELLEEFNFFVPEIQREYVWGQDDRSILSAFCDDIIEGKNTIGDEEAFQSKIAKLTAEKKYDEIPALLAGRSNGEMMNIGFLYSYEPNYKMEHFPDSDLFKDTYLIDGQQRFTSLFLILFYLSIKEGRIKEFKQLLRYDYKSSTIAFDYRVRTLTHDFIIKLLNEVKTVDDFDSVKDSTWFVNTYLQDFTIESMVNALRIIELQFEDLEDNYYDYIIENIKFWHFKTEKTNQGEELYITMNSRGKQLEENETVRAKLFEKLNGADQISWSEKWENWQDFFWKHRGAKGNADYGFNEFLKCIAGLESYLNNKTQFVEDEDKIYDSHILSNITLELLENYFEVFNYLLNNKENFKELYEYSAWVDKAINFLCELIFDDTTNWFVDYTDELQATERSRIVFVWSVFRYIKEIKSQKVNLEVQNVFRLLRIYWLRYNNLDRSVTNLKERIDDTLMNGVWTQHSTNEESVKQSFYLKYMADNSLLKKFESRIWKIEDHRLNINGYQVKNINSIHLIDYENLTDHKILDEIYKKFISLFPNDLKESEYDSRINDVLMFYGFYGMRRSPNYYFNYDFGSWRRIIRDLDTESNVFGTFFQDYDSSNLAHILTNKKQNFLKAIKAEDINHKDKLINITTFHDAIKLYISTCSTIWSKGRYLANYESWLKNKSFTTFERSPNQKPPYFQIFNTKGDFKGDKGNSPIVKYLPKDYWKELLKKVELE